MKKMLVLVMVMTLFVGCSSVNNFFCKPTEAQIQAANVGEALAQSALTALATFSGNPAVVAISTQALPVFRQVIAGYCTTQQSWDAAINALQVAQQNPVAAKAMRITGEARAVENPISYLQSVTWGK